MAPHRSTRWIALASSSSRLLSGLFQSIWMKRCSGNRRSTEASGVTVAEIWLGQLHSASWS